MSKEAAAPSSATFAGEEADIARLVERFTKAPTSADVRREVDDRLEFSKLPFFSEEEYSRQIDAARELDDLLRRMRASMLAAMASDNPPSPRDLDILIKVARLGSFEAGRVSASNPVAALRALLDASDEKRAWVNRQKAIQARSSIRREALEYCAEHPSTNQYQLLKHIADKLGVSRDTVRDVVSAAFDPARDEVERDHDTAAELADVHEVTIEVINAGYGTDEAVRVRDAAANAIQRRKESPRKRLNALWPKLFLGGLL